MCNESKIRQYEVNSTEIGLWAVPAFVEIVKREAKKLGFDYLSTTCRVSIKLELVAEDQGDAADKLGDLLVEEQEVPLENVQRA